MAHDNLLGDVQAERVPTGHALVLADALERLEHGSVIGGGDADALIAHGDLGVAIQPTHRHSDLTAVRRVLHGIADDGGEHLVYASDIPAAHDRLGRVEHERMRRCALRYILEALEHERRHRREIGRLAMQLEASTLEARRIEQLVDQPIQAVRALDQVFNHAGELVGIE